MKHQCWRPFFQMAMESTSRSFHIKSRIIDYPKSNGLVKRFLVPDDKVSWSVEWTAYKPPFYNSPHLKNAAWADNEVDDDLKAAWNSIDGKINRVSWVCQYKIVNGLPQNPIGRTGLRGRGVLGRYGPNHAADPIVTRWKRDTMKTIITHPGTEKPVLQFVGITRRDNRECAIPGGMVDAGENVSSTLKREFMEEACNSLEMSGEQKRQLNGALTDFFSKGKEIYRGYVDDPRNTDNAWIETVACNFHDEDGSFVGSLPFSSGDDAIGVHWVDVDSNSMLYASHSDLIKIVAISHNAHW